MDQADNQVLETMTQVISSNRKPEWVDVHNLKTIRYGSLLYIDCDLTLPWYYNIVQGHEACDELRDAIATGFDNRVQVSIHSDPCHSEQCPRCAMTDCAYRNAPFTSSLALTLQEVTRPDEEREA